MAEHRKTRAAERDIEDIAFYGIQKFGVAQAQSYHEGLEARLAAISANPLQYQAVDHIRAGYRRSVYGSHSIYFVIEPEGVLIVRILRAQDRGRELP